MAVSRHWLRRTEALTLVELLAAVTIGAIVLTAGLGVYTSFVRQAFATSIDQRLQSEGSNALHFLTDKLHHAARVQILSGGSASSTLEMEEYDGSVATVSFDANAQTLRYTLAGRSGTLTRDVTVADWQTDPVKANIVQIHLVLQDKGFLRVPVTHELSTAVYTRLP